MKLSNKTIVVTGVSSGIGAETARALRAHGATVIGVDRNEPSLTLDGFVQADLSHADAIDAAVQQLPAQVDGLCNIAGVPGTADPQLVARVNYLGLRHLSEAMLPRIRAGGAIVNGALAANFKLGNSNGTYDAKYDEAALSNIRTGAAFQTLKQVPGSWRDW